MARLTLEQRQALGSLAGQSVNIAQLARKYNCTEQAIRRWLAEGEKASPNYFDAPGRGRPPKLTSSQKTRVRQQAANRRGARSIAAHLKHSKGISVSPTTIRRVIKSGRKAASWKPVMRGRVLSDRNKKHRLTFCSTKPSIPITKWVFLDGKFVFGYKDGKKYAHYSWQFGDTPPPTLPAGSPTVLFFYAAVAHGHKSKLYFVAPSAPLGSKARKSKESFNSKHYIAMMQELQHEIDAWYPDGNYNIIRDRARQHTSKSSTEAMHGLGLKIDEDFPAQSWDINIIENAWGLLDDNLLGKRPRSSRGWRETVVDAWGAIDQSSIDMLVASVSKRMRAAVENKGAWP